MSLRSRLTRTPAAPAVAPPSALTGLSLSTGRNAVEEVLAELQATGALDEGNGGALDHLIDTWRDQHREALRAAQLERQAAAERALAATDRELAAARLAAEDAARAVKHHTSVVDEAIAALLGRQPVIPGQRRAERVARRRAESAA